MTDLEIHLKSPWPFGFNRVPHRKAARRKALAQREVSIAFRRSAPPAHSNSHCGQGPAETGGFCASDLQTSLMSWLESGLGVALVWPWCGFGVALVWLWGGSGVALVWLWGGFGVALVWLWGGSVLRSLCLVYAQYMPSIWL